MKQAALPAVIPHWVHYDKRCLKFTAFFKQPVFENPDENYRVRVVNIVYFLEDDTITVIEPRVKVIQYDLFKTETLSNKKDISKIKLNW